MYVKLGQAHYAPFTALYLESEKLIFWDKNMSEDEKLYIKFFNAMVDKYRADKIPGFYGGESRNDLLALVKSGDDEVLVLGPKFIDSTSGFQIENQSLGLHMQFSEDWLKVLIYSLSLKSETARFSERIKKAVYENRLTTAVLTVNSETDQVSLVNVANGFRENEL